MPLFTELLVFLLVSVGMLAIGIWIGKSAQPPTDVGSGALASSLQLLQKRETAFFTESPFAVLVDDGNGNIVDANPIAGEYLNCASNRLKGTRLEEIFPPSLKPHVEDLLAGGTPGRPHRVETKIARSGGDTIPVEIFCRRVKNGTTELRVLFLRNIAERKRREFELTEATRHLKFHLENGPLAYIEFDEKFRVTKWSRNAEHMFGWKASDVNGNHPFDWDFVYDEDAERMEEAFLQLSRTDAPARSTWKMKQYRKDGTTLECRWFHSSERDEKGKPISHFCLIRDTEDSLLNAPLEVSGRSDHRLGETRTQELNLIALHRERQLLKS
ncbi:MAG: PAS domain-containing protein [Verrucomicrobiota bacterium]